MADDRIGFGAAATGVLSGIASGISLGKWQQNKNRHSLLMQSLQPSGSTGDTAMDQLLQNAAKGRKIWGNAALFTGALAALTAPVTWSWYRAKQQPQEQ